MSTNPSKDRLFLQAFTTGISKAKKPDKIEYELYSRSLESGIFFATTTIGSTVVISQFDDADNNQIFDQKIDKAIFPTPDNDVLVKIDGKDAFLSDDNYNDGKVTWSVMQSDGSKATYTIDLKSEKKAKQLGKQFEKAAKKGEAEAFLAKHSEK